MAVAYCWRSGRIQVGRVLPDGAMSIARGPEKALRRIVVSTSRHAYRRRVYLVPGVPEAPNDDAALQAARRFVAWAFGSRVPVSVSPTLCGEA